MELLYDYAESAANLYDAVAGIMFMFLICGRAEKYKSKKIFWLYSGIYMVVLAFLQDKSDSYFMQTAIIVAILFVYARHLLSSQMIEQAMYSMIFAIVLFMASLLTNIFCMWILRTSVPEVTAEGGIDRFIGLVSNKLMFTAILCAVVMVKRRVSFVLKDSVIGIMLLAAVLCIGVSVTQVWNSDIELVSYSGHLLMFVIGFVTMCAVAVACIYRLRIQNHYKLENEIMKAKLDEERDMLERIREMYEDNRILRHDLKRYLTIVQGLLADDDIQGASKYIERVIDTHFESHLTVYSNSSVVNAVINDIKNKCEKSEVKIQVYIASEIPENLQYHIGIILSNILENAYEAELSEPEDSRTISIRMQLQKGMYSIRIENYIGSSILETNPELATHKREKENHGIGLKSVRKLAAELNGICSFYESNHMFISAISIPIHVNRA